MKQREKTTSKEGAHPPVRGNPFARKPGVTSIPPYVGFGIGGAGVSLMATALDSYASPVVMRQALAQAALTHRGLWSVGDDVE